MTIVVAFHCSDGVVIAADSMITPSMGGINVGHHHGRKIEIVSGPQLFAFAGDQGQSARFRIMAEGSHGQIAAVNHPMDYALALSAGIIQQFLATGIGSNAIGVNTILAFGHGGQHHCCMFEGALQPRLLDAHHYYAALGSGKLSADPFLRFLVDVFCPNGRPTMREAMFLATWAIQHVIDTNPGGVAGPIRVATFDTDQAGNFQAKELPDEEIAEHQQAIESAAAALRKWRDEIQSGDAAEDAPEPPTPPQPPSPPTPEPSKKVRFISRTKSAEADLLAPARKQP
jgi:20S proteasome alpha/beta subunit